MPRQMSKAARKDLIEIEKVLEHLRERLQDLQQDLDQATTWLSHVIGYYRDEEDD